jgi:hypothetical protein
MLTGGQLTAGEVAPVAPALAEDGSGFDEASAKTSWQETLVLAGVSLVLSAVVMGFVAFIADHIVWG